MAHHLNDFGSGRTVHGARRRSAPLHLEALESRVVPTNTAPVAYNDSYSVEHDHVLTESFSSMAILPNDYDADFDPLTISIVSSPAHGQLTQNRDGTYLYTPNASYVGTDSFTIKVNDGVADSNTATITLNVTQYAPLNGDGSYTVLHDHTLANIDFSANDSAANGDPAAITIVTGPSHGTLTPTRTGLINMFLTPGTSALTPWSSASQAATRSRCRSTSRITPRRCGRPACPWRLTRACLTGWHSWRMSPMWMPTR